jgi:hypothetical protein
MSHQVAADDKAGAHSATEQLEYANGVKDATENVINEDIMVVRTMNPNEKAAALAAASLADPGVKYMSRRGLQLLGIVLVCLVCGTDNGFDSGGKSTPGPLPLQLTTAAMSNINAMQPFLDFFGFEEAQASTGILFGMYTVGGVSGFFLNASLPDLLGRRKAMAISNSILIVGILLAGLSRNLAMFLIVSPNREPLDPADGHTGSLLHGSRRHMRECRRSVLHRRDCPSQAPRPFPRVLQRGSECRFDHGIGLRYRFRIHDE